jgi:uncharacterized membrane protein
MLTKIFTIIMCLIGFVVGLMISEKAEKEKENSFVEAEGNE